MVPMVSSSTVDVLAVGEALTAGTVLIPCSVPTGLPVFIPLGNVSPRVPARLISKVPRPEDKSPRTSQDDETKGSCFDDDRLSPLQARWTTVKDPAFRGEKTRSQEP